LQHFSFSFEGVPRTFYGIVFMRMCCLGPVPSVCLALIPGDTLVIQYVWHATGTFFFPVHLVEQIFLAVFALCHLPLDVFFHRFTSVRSLFVSLAFLFCFIEVDIQRAGGPRFVQTQRWLLSPFASPISSRTLLFCVPLFFLPLVFSCFKLLSSEPSEVVRRGRSLSL